MRQKIIMGIVLATVLFLGAGLYIIASIEKGTAAIDNLVMLHQVEILREHLLLRIKGVQINLMSVAIEGATQQKLQSTLATTTMLTAFTQECTGCHHEAETMQRLRELDGHVRSYQDSVVGALNLVEKGKGAIPELYDASIQGDHVIEHVESMIMGTSQKLESRTRETLAQVNRMKGFIIGLLAVGPLFTVMLGLLFLRSVTRPITRLLGAINKIEHGELDFQVKGFRDEFREVGNAFNRMAASLKDQVARAQSSEQRYRTLFHNAGDAIFVFELEGDDPGRIVEANKAAAEMHGYTLEEIAGLNIIRDIDSDTDADLAPERMERIFKGEWIQTELQHRRKDGSLFPLEISAGMVEFEGKRYVLAFDRDITERKRSERRLRLFSEAVEAAREGIQLVGLDGKILYSNKAVEDIYGISPVELEGTDVGRMNADPGLAEREILPALMQDGAWQGEIDVRHKDGTTFPISLSTSVIREQGGRPIALVGIIRDITENKRMEQDLIRAKEDWENTFDTITDMITIHDNDYNIIRANKAARENLGLPSLTDGEVKCYHCYHGTDKPQKGCVCHERASEAREIYEPHLGRYLEMRSIPRFEGGVRMGQILIARDVTDRRRTQRALQRADRMEMVGIMAAGLAHEIKNPLAGIKVTMEVLSNELELPPEDKALVARVVDEIRRIETLMKGLLDFARPPKPVMTPVKLDEFIKKALAFLIKFPQFQGPDKPAISVVQDIPEDLPTVLIDGMQMQQVFMNLVYNAINVMPNGGTLTISCVHAEERGMAVIRFKDTGPGIPPGDLNRIFEPFYTTSPKGTGLGLSISRQLVEHHGGSLKAENSPEGGAEFTVTLPVAERSSTSLVEA